MAKGRSRSAVYESGVMGSESSEPGVPRPEGWLVSALGDSLVLTGTHWREARSGMRRFRLLVRRLASCCLVPSGMTIESL